MSKLKNGRRDPSHNFDKIRICQVCIIKTVQEKMVQRERGRGISKISLSIDELLPAVKGKMPELEERA